jgi:hypothetical protein
MPAYQEIRMAKPPAVDLPAALDEAVAGRRAVVKHAGRRVAVVPVADLERLEELDRLGEAADAAEARESWAEYVASGRKGTPVDQVRRELGLD